MRFLRVHDWADYQTWVDGVNVPEWIKVHISILNSYKFARLSDVAKGHLVFIWMLAARLNDGGLIPYDSPWVTRQIGAGTPVNLHELVKLGFLEEVPGERQNGTLTVAECESRCQNGAVPDAHTDSETDSDTDTTMGISDPTPDPRPDQKPAPLKVDWFFDEWNQMAAAIPTIPTVRSVTTGRRHHATARQKEHGPSGLRQVLLAVRASRFLRNEVAKSPEHPNFRVDIDWVLAPRNFAKILEGKYPADYAGPEEVLADRQATEAAIKARIRERQRLQEEADKANADEVARNVAEGKERMVGVRQRLRTEEAERLEREAAVLEADAEAEADDDRRERILALAAETRRKADVARHEAATAREYIYGSPS